MATALRAAGSTLRPISMRVSSTWTISLRILLFICVSMRGSTLSIPLADLRGLQPADARMHARAGAHRQDEDDLAGGRRAGHAHFHRVEMAAHVGGVDVRQRHVQAGARRSDLLGGG